MQRLGLRLTWLQLLVIVVALALCGAIALTALPPKPSTVVVRGSFASSTHADYSSDARTAPDIAGVQSPGVQSPGVRVQVGAVSLSALERRDSFHPEGVPSGVTTAVPAGAE